jgi:stalled ribosome rescue protein Dom34
MSHHAVVWIDHHEARVFQFSDDKLHSELIKAHPHGPTHRGVISHEVDHDFLKQVANDLAAAEKILVVGPATAKLELVRWLHRHAPKTETKVVGVESVDHPTDGQLVAYARQYFKASDRMR